MRAPLVVGWAATLIAYLASLGGCLRATEFKCIDSTQCSGGVCQAAGYCSFSDSSCPSGQRFGESAGTYGGQCVEGGSDAGVDAPSDMSLGACPNTYVVVAGAPVNRVYRVINTSADWDSQRDACAADGANAYLAIPDDVAESMAIHLFAPANNDYWIGVTDVATEGTFLNVKGDEQTFLPWGTGQPNNRNDSDCVEVRDSGDWNDAECSDSSVALCECEL